MDEGWSSSIEPPSPGDISHFCHPPSTERIRVHGTPEIGCSHSSAASSPSIFRSQSMCHRSMAASSSEVPSACGHCCRSRTACWWPRNVVEHALHPERPAPQRYSRRSGALDLVRGRPRLGRRLLLFRGSTPSGSAWLAGGRPAFGNDSGPPSDLRFLPQIVAYRWQGTSTPDCETRRVQRGTGHPQFPTGPEAERPTGREVSVKKMQPRAFH